ncbi:MAG: ABC transporter ATP-binding protein [SAR202 cluster bacterium]|nr:ABC transporter ATP-binding protein [SAR202 cluster bacterium]
MRQATEHGPILSVEGLTKRFRGGTLPAVSGLSLTMGAGETLALMGPSGSGKTTTLRLIAGFETPYEGKVSIAGRIVAVPGLSVPTEQRGLGMMFQQFALFPHLTVEQNVAYGLAGLPREEKARRVEEELRVVGMDDFKKRYPRQLSGGQQQRVALARALAPRPVVMLMDEPFGSLDARMRTEMRRDVKAVLRQTNTTTILVTHDKDEAFTLADRVLVMKDGVMQQLDTPDNIYHRPANRFVAEFAGMADFVAARFEDGAVSTEVGLFSYQGPRPDGPFDLLLRPDTVEVTSYPNGDCAITGREFKGAINLYSVRLPSGKTIWSAMPSQQVHRVGERVKVRAKPNSIVLFPR